MTAVRPTAVSLAVLDDHELVRDGLVALLAGADDPDLRVVYSGVDPREAAASGALVALLDVDLGPEAPGVAASTALLVAAGLRVLLLSALADPAAVRAGLDAGALGFVPKSASSVALLDAVRTVADGEVHLTAALAAVLLAGSSAPDLSSRELEALRLYAAGLKLTSVARRMNVTASTAKEYLDRVRAKYRMTGQSVSTRSDLQRAAERDGLLRE